MRVVVLALLVLLPTVAEAVGFSLPEISIKTGVGLPILAPPLVTNGPESFKVVLDSGGGFFTAYYTPLKAYDAQGHLRWSRDFAGGSSVMGLAVTPDDGVLAAARCILPCARDVPVVRRYAADGMLLWERTVFAATGQEDLRGFAADAQGDAVLVTSSFGGGCSPSWLMNVTTLSADGTVRWKRSFCAATIQVASAPSGDIVLSVEGSGPRVSRYDRDGQLRWSRTDLGAWSVFAADDATLVDRDQLTKLDGLGRNVWSIEHGPHAAQSHVYTMDSAGRVLVVTDWHALPSLGPYTTGGYRVDAYDAATGAWLWFFHHLSGTLNGYPTSASARGGLLAIGGLPDSPVYRLSWSQVDCLVPPPLPAVPGLLNPPDLRTCAFLP